MTLVPAKMCFGNNEDQPQHLVPKSEFSPDKSRDDGLCVYCKSCAAARQRAWKHANQAKVKAAKRAYLDKKKQQ
jgi:hypothetical protein